MFKLDAVKSAKYKKMGEVSSDSPDNIFKAIYRDDEKAVEAFIKQDKKLLESVTHDVIITTLTSTPLMAAIRSFHFSLAEKIVELGGDVKAISIGINNPDALPNPVLGLAVMRDEDFTKYLLALPQISRHEDEAMIYRVFLSVIKYPIQFMDIFLQSKKLTLLTLVRIYDALLTLEPKPRDFKEKQSGLLTAFNQQCQSIDPDNFYDMTDAASSLIYACDEKKLKKLGAILFGMIKDRQNKRKENVAEDLFKYTYNISEKSLKLAEFLIQEKVNIELPTIIDETVGFNTTRGIIPVIRVGTSALLNAIPYQNEALVKLLLDNGANPNKPLVFYPKYFSREDVAAGAKIPEEIKFQVEVLDGIDIPAVEMADIEAMEMKDNENQKFVENFKEQEEKCFQGCEKQISNSQNSQNPVFSFAMGVTPLMLAIQIGNDNIIDMLLARKLHLDVADIDGNTALMHAVKRDDLKTAEKLIAKGANKDIINHFGQTACMLTLNIEIAQLLTTPDNGSGSESAEQKTITKPVQTQSTPVLPVADGTAQHLNLGVLSNASSSVSVSATNEAQQEDEDWVEVPSDIATIKIT